MDDGVKKIKFDRNMDKKFFLAAMLSFMVLYIWSAVISKPNQQSTFLKGAQLGLEQKDTASSNRQEHFLEKRPASTTTIEEIQATNIQPKEVSEKIEIIENDKLKVSFSNIGGTLDSVFIKGYDVELPLTKMISVFGYEEVEFLLEEKNYNNVIYVYENNEYLIRKIYTLLKNEYALQIDVSIQNKDKMSNLEDIAISAYTIDMSSLDIKSEKNGQKVSEARDKSLNEYIIYTTNNIIRKNNAYKFSPKERKVEQGKIKWVGYRNRYYCALIKPLFDTYGYSINSLNNRKLKIDIEKRVINFSKEKEINFSFLNYFGPEKVDLLKQYDMEFEKIKKYYRFGLFDMIAKFIHKIMQLIYKIIPNWGVCILIISVIIYFSMYPLTRRSMLSMKKMQALQPKITILKEKYKSNPQKMNEETMKIYKENKINPLGGCLPMLLQMPVFIGLYQVLWRSVAFKGEGFLWIKDLSAPDRLIILQKTWPIIGNEINILPLVMMVVMYFQQKLSAKNMAGTDPAQIAQQKMMGKIFPLFLGFIFYKFASGLTLYFTMFYFFSTYSQWKMAKEQKAA